MPSGLLIKQDTMNVLWYFLGRLGWGIPQIQNFKTPWVGNPPGTSIIVAVPRTWKWLVAIFRVFLKATGALTTWTPINCFWPPPPVGPVDDTREIDDGKAWKGGTGTATTEGTPTLVRDGRETLWSCSVDGGRGLKGGTVTAEALLLACWQKSGIIQQVVIFTLRPLYPLGLVPPVPSG